MGLKKSRWLYVVLLVIALCIIRFVFIPMFGRVNHCSKNKVSANLRSLSIGHAIRFAEDRRHYDPDTMSSMKGFLYSMAVVDFTDTGIILNDKDRFHFKSEPPAIFAYRNDANELIFDDRILDYPMGFSIAVYPDMARSTSMTPILWTRDLDRYASFDQPYGGHVAFLDGHVEFLAGVPNEPNPRLEALFGPQGESSHALRILRHVPEGFAALELAPLPVRYHQELSKPDWRRLRMGLVVLSPGLLAGLLVFLVSKRSGWARLRTAGLAFVIVQIAVVVLIPIRL